MLIVFCGVDGSGKSTYLTEIEKYLKNNGLVCSLIDPMKKGKLSQSLKKTLCNTNENINSVYDPTLVSVSYALDMLYFMNKFYDNNSIFLSHRYDICCCSYATLKKADINYIKLTVDQLPMPDLTVYIKIDPDIAYNRILKRNKKLSWKENKSILSEVSKIYDKEFEKLRRPKILIDNTIEENLNDNIVLLKTQIDKILNLKRL